MLIRNLVPVEEAYFGKTKNLLRCEQILQKIIDSLKIKKVEKMAQRVIDTPKLNKSKLNKELCDAIQEEFGFGEVYIHWDGTDTVNAYTATCSGFIKLIATDMPKLPVKNGDKYYDQGHSYLCAINIYAGLIDYGLTAEEILAVMLHEIGHNFECTPMTTVLTFTDILWIPIEFAVALQAYPQLNESGDNFIKFLRLSDQVIKGIIYGFFDAVYNLGRGFFPQFIKDELEDFDKYIEEHKNLVKAQLLAYIDERKRMEEEMKRKVDVTLTAPVTRFLSTVFTVAKDTVIHPAFLVRDLYDAYSGYGGEVFADSFATAYGYGPALASSFKKFSTMVQDTQYLAKNNRSNVFNQCMIVFSDVFANIMDPHPMDQTRIKNQLNKLKREVNSANLDPEVKGSILKDIARTEKVYDAYIHLDPKYRYLTILINFRNFNETYFGGKLDLRDYLNRLLNLGKAEA